MIEYSYGGVPPKGVNNILPSQPHSGLLTLIVKLGVLSLLHSPKFAVIDNIRLGNDDPIEFHPNNGGVELFILIICPAVQPDTCHWLPLRFHTISKLFVVSSQVG